MQRIIEIFNELEPRKNSGYLKSLDKEKPYYLRVKRYQEEVATIFSNLSKKEQSKIRRKVEYINNCFL